MFLYVCVLDTTVSPTKTDESTEMLFGLWTWVFPRNHVLGGWLGALIPQGKGQFCPPSDVAFRPKFLLSLTTHFYYFWCATLLEAKIHRYVLPISLQYFHRLQQCIASTTNSLCGGNILVQFVMRSEFQQYAVLSFTILGKAAYPD